MRDMFKSKGKTGHRMLQSLTLPEDVFLQNPGCPQVTDECEAKSPAHRKISSFNKSSGVCWANFPCLCQEGEQASSLGVSCTLRLCISQCTQFGPLDKKL